MVAPYATEVTKQRFELLTSDSCSDRKCDS